MIEAIRLDRHGVFEASAGTGKTYTIVQLVLRLLREGKCRFDEVLLVTFTEKATGELRDRMRRELEAAVDREDCPAFRHALDHYDQAPIFTIHGFCTWLLGHYAAELGQDLRFELVDDKTCLEEVLPEIQKRDWHRTFGKGLAEVLGAAEFRRRDADLWEKRVRELTKIFRPEHDHRLVPTPRADGNGIGNTVGNASGPFDLVIFTMQRCQAELARRKRERGQVSYDDMTRFVAEGLDPARNPRAPALLRELRRRYRFAVVDEFQDTDPQQWRIFRQLFVDGDASRLYLVGDPKQAIYDFRGADLPTYLAATRHLEKECGADVHRLPINWRSTPELIDVLNTFFDTGKFFPGIPAADLAASMLMPDITYTAVQSPPADKRRAIITRDDSGRAALTIFDAGITNELAEARRQYAKLVAAEIARLLGHGTTGPLLEFQLNGETRRLKADDFCLLVFRRSEAADFEKALATHNIPSCFHKPNDFRRSGATTDVVLLLKALADAEDEAPFRRLLMTRFFRLPPTAVLEAGSLPSAHPARQLFRKWVEFAQERRWSALFASVVEESGVLMHERGESGYDRDLAHLRYVVGRLEEDAYRENLDLEQLIERAASPRYQGTDGDNPPPETEEPRVRIMTIHSAKGLEFPIVVLAGGFTGYTPPESIRRYRDDDNRLVLDLELTWGQKRSPASRADRWKAYRRDEWRRLLYVALTRAQLKLIIPHVLTATRDYDAPLTQIVVPALRASGLAEQRIESLGLADTTPSIATTDATALPAQAPARLGPLYPALDPEVRSRRIRIQSFTRLARRVAPEEDVFGEPVVELAADERVEPLPAAEEFQGPIFGQLVHAVFERIDFADARAADSPEHLDDGPARRILDEEIPRHLPKLAGGAPLEPLAVSCRQLVRRLVWNTLRTPLPFLGARLCDVPRDDRIEELEFLLPAAELKRAFPQSAADGVEDWFLTGFMDLLFRREGKLYLLDWKTNVLPAYGPTEVTEAMDEANYHLQYRLYLRALDGWLQRVHGPRTRLEDHVGGVYYLFVRGMNGSDDGGGVFHKPATSALIDFAEAPS
jgi:exodeoxyribonuclease V beta subunit